MANRNSTTPSAALEPSPGRIPAIQTVWNGYLFRSRAEARWAVLFDSLGISYDYEMEGFHLSPDCLYLPDFYLPRVKMWAEVKPAQFSSVERTKCDLLVRDTSRGCILLDGAPDFRTYEGLTLDSGDITAARYLLDIDASGRRYYLRERRFFADPGDLTLWDFSERYINAVAASRRERFRNKCAFPRLGHEPFNLSPAEMRDAWAVSE